MAHGSVKFEFRNDFAAYLPGHGVPRAGANYVTWMNRAAKRLGLSIGPNNLSNEGDVQALMGKLHDIDQRDPAGSLLNNSLDASNQRSAFRKYAEMVESNYRGLFGSVANSTASQKNHHPQTKETIAIVWRDKDSDGYTDIFPYDTFARMKTGVTLTHSVAGPKGGISTAKCRLTVAAKTADLDYEAFGPFNIARKMLLGVVRFEFADADRTAVSRVWWKPKGAQVFALTAFDPVTYTLAPLPDYVGPGKHAKKVLKKVRERPGQAAFRRRLKLAYGNTCCVTGCAVAVVLDGAHIDPYLGPDFDHPQNGLLLRRDIHTLIDAYLIGIEPTSKTLCVANAVRHWAEYAALQGKSLRLPIVGGKTYHPAVHALERRWTIFMAKQGA
jgi:hypothetical protein